MAPRSSKCILCTIWKNKMSAQMLEVSLLLIGVKMVLRLERDAWSMVKWLRQARNYPPPAPRIYIICRLGWRQLATTLL